MDRFIFSRSLKFLPNIKDSHIRPFRIKSMTDGFGNIDKVIKEDLQVLKEILFEASDFGGIGYFVKNTKVTQVSRIMKKDQ